MAAAPHEAHGDPDSRSTAGLRRRGLFRGAVATTPGKMVLLLRAQAAVAPAAGAMSMGSGWVLLIWSNGRPPLTAS